MKNRVSVPLLVVCAGLLAVACGLGINELTSREDARPALSENVQGLSSAPFFKLSVGEECTKYSDRNGACASGLCLTVSPGFPPRGFCSISCEPGQPDACPDGPAAWQCLQAYPSWWVCAPPPGHTSAEATLKRGKMPLPSRKPSVVPYPVRPPPDGGRQGP